MPPRRRPTVYDPTARPKAPTLLRALVAAGPILRLDAQQRRVCAYCGGPMMPPDTPYLDLLAHTPTCPYRLAYVWAQRHAASSTERSA